jgi:hypothetical protein
MVDSSGVNWGLGIPQTNPGAAFADAYRQGLQQHRQDAARQAMAALVQNPNDPKALAALAESRPVRPRCSSGKQNGSPRQQGATSAQHHD